MKIWLTLSAHDFCDMLWRRYWNTFGHVLTSTALQVLQASTSDGAAVEQQGPGSVAQVDIRRGKGWGPMTRMMMVTWIVEVSLQQGQLQGQLLCPIGVWFHHVQAAQTLTSRHHSHWLMGSKYVNKKLRAMLDFLVFLVFCSYAIVCVLFLLFCFFHFFESLLRVAPTRSLCSRVEVTALSVWPDVLKFL